MARIFGLRDLPLAPLLDVIACRDVGGMFDDLLQWFALCDPSWTVARIANTELERRARMEAES